ncbi:IS3 family transposase [Burkholderia diffusa]|uniref:IS3 family transposase n=2 Tax=Burkholderiaceae TaxID=119060 RepID=UPI00157AC8BA|nr:IS3 family transposase [Burkholderia diffusa]NTY38471.1 transposase [Burkholderia diffusa]
MTERAMGVTRACGLVGISRSLFYYESRRRVDDEALTGRMMAIAAQKCRYGYRRIHVLLQRDGCFANHKRIWRLYSKAGLSVRKRRRKRIAAVERTPLPLPTGPNQSWSMDFLWSTRKPQAQTGGDRRLAFIYPAYSDPIEVGSGLHDVVARFRPN